MSAAIKAESRAEHFFMCRVMPLIMIWAVGGSALVAWYFVLMMGFWLLLFFAVPFTGLTAVGIFILVCNCPHRRSP